MNDMLEHPAGGASMVGACREWFITPEQRVRCVWLGDKWTVRYLNSLTHPDAVREREQIRSLMTRMMSAGSV